MFPVLSMGPEERPTGAAPPGGMRAGVGLFLRVLRANPLSFVGFILVVLIVVTAALVVIIPAVSGALGHSVSLLPYDPNAPNPAHIFAPPSLAHPMGTDDVGQDLFSRVLAALPTDLFIGVVIAGGALLVGGGLGLVAGYWDTPRTLGGVMSAGIMRVTDIFLAFPSLLLALAIAASLGRGEIPSLIAVFATWWPYYVRLTRGEVLVIRQQPYIVAARAAGVSSGRILVRHVVRNLIEPLAVYFTLDIGTVIVTYSTISYVGIGVPQSIPEWGNMIESYQTYLLSDPGLIGFVALAIFVTVLGFSLMGDGLRDVLDPRSRRTLVTSTASTTTTPSASAPLPSAGEP
ncbi:MAG TPA: ABC transporter permease [Thermoplasmata archaeon]|nr:ABC transporter permease [Thermoplasmata archaeon]